jgi:cold shock protein
VRCLPAECPLSVVARETGRPCHPGDVTSSGVVREFHPEQGWGVIDGPDVPGGCWVHFSAIVMDGYRHLAAGQEVSFRHEAPGQDGYPYRAAKVWTGSVEPIAPAPRAAASGAYRSSSTLTFDPPHQP